MDTETVVDGASSLTVHTPTTPTTPTAPYPLSPTIEEELNPPLPSVDDDLNPSNSPVSNPEVRVDVDDATSALIQTQLEHEFQDYLRSVQGENEGSGGGDDGVSSDTSVGSGGAGTVDDISGSSESGKFLLCLVSILLYLCGCVFYMTMLAEHRSL